MTGLLLGMSSCGDDALTAACRRTCQSLACGDGDVTACRRQCVARMNDAEDIDDPCATSYRLLLECLDDVGCGDIGDWEALRGEDTEYACRLETDEFIAACPGLWFAP
jgi:hypothetical protein